MSRTLPVRWVSTLGALSVLSLAGSARAGHAQTVVLDEGTFTISVEGRVAGTETFTIRREGAGDEATLLANAVVTIEGEHPGQMRPMLKTGVDRSPIEYANTVEGGDVSAVSVRHMGRHFRTTISSTAGERERELPVRPVSILLDRRVAHHYWFLGNVLDRTGVVVAALEPQSGQQLRMEVASVSAEAVQIGGQRLNARRVTLAVGSETRTIWFDDQGRVLQVDVPSAGYRAVRVEG